MDVAMESSSMYEKNLDRICGEKLKKSPLQDTLEKLSFWYESFGSKTSGDKHLEI